MNRIVKWLYDEAMFVAENIRSEFATHRSKLGLFAVTGLLFSLYIAIPVHFIYGNTLFFYLTIEPIWGFGLLGALALGVSSLITPRILHAEIELTGNALADISTLLFSFLPSMLACPILAVAALSFILPVTTIWSLVGSKWLIVAIFTVVAFGANYWKYSGCAKCQQWT